MSGPARADVPLSDGVSLAFFKMVQATGERREVKYSFRVVETKGRRYLSPHYPLDRGEVQQLADIQPFDDFTQCTVDPPEGFPAVLFTVRQDEFTVEAEGGRSVGRSLDLQTGLRSLER